MKVKTYKLFKTVKKTAKENNLIIGDDAEKKNILFDFSLLDDLKIEENKKERIKRDALERISPMNREQFYEEKPDNFSGITDDTQYYIHRVFSNSGIRLYNIMQLAKIIHKEYERKNVDECWEKTLEINLDSGYDAPLEDYEI